MRRGDSFGAHDRTKGILREEIERLTQAEARSA